MAWLDFQDSLVFSDDHYVMGRKLKPFCLEYQFWLEVLESPLFVVGGRKIENDIELAAHLELISIVCSCDYREANKLKDYKPNIFRKISLAWRTARYDLELEFAKFQRYLQDYCSLPETMKEGGSKDKKFTEFPTVLSTSSLLIKNGFEGGNREKVFMTPLGEAHWYAISFIRHAGQKTNLVTEQDREFMEGIRKMREQKKQNDSDSSS